jgi:hypothetical protein
MTNETMKALLTILIIGGLQAAIHVPKIWASRQRAFLFRIKAYLRSTSVLTDRTLQPALIKRRVHDRQLSR